MKRYRMKKSDIIQTLIIIVIAIFIIGAIMKFVVLPYIDKMKKSSKNLDEMIEENSSEEEYP